MMKVSLLTTALALVMLAVASFGGSQASANGIHAGSREVFSGSVGPYFLRVSTAPFVGTMHFVVFLAHADETQPVDEAEIALSGQPAGGESPPIGPVHAIPSLDGPNLFTADVPVNEVGQWVFTMRVLSEAGEESVHIPLTVGRRGSINLGVVGILLVLVVAAGLVALSWGRKRRRRRGRGARR